MWLSMAAAKAGIRAPQVPGGWADREAAPGAPGGRFALRTRALSVAAAGPALSETTGPAVHLENVEVMDEAVEERACDAAPSGG